MWAVFLPHPVIANAGLEGDKTKTRSGQWPASLRLEHPGVIPCYRQFRKIESITCFIGNSRSQTVPPPHTTSSAQLIPSVDILNGVPSFTSWGSPLHTRDSVSESWLLWLGRARKRKWKVLNQPLSDNGILSSTPWLQLLPCFIICIIYLFKKCRPCPVDVKPNSYHVKS